MFHDPTENKNNDDCKQVKQDDQNSCILLGILKASILNLLTLAFCHDYQIIVRLLWIKVSRISLNVVPALISVLQLIEVITLIVQEFAIDHL